MNHTIPIMKSQSQTYKNHLAPIAPAPLLAPKPVQVLPKPFNNVSRSSSSTSISTLKTSRSVDSDSTQTLPCIISSKQWVLPPRPKAGRKASIEKKKLLPSTSTTSMQSLSNNMTSLNLQKSQSEIINTNSEFINKGINTVNLGSVSIDHNLKVQLESATEENQKLKNIITRLKSEIDSLQKVQFNSSSSITDYSSPLGSLPVTMERTNSITSVSTPNTTTTNTALPSRDVSPTVDPKYIGMGQSAASTPGSTSATIASNVSGQQKPRPKRQYKKKKKKEEIAKQTEESPSPISLSSIPWDKNHSNNSGLPKIENIVKQNNVETDLDYNKPKKKTKTIKLEKGTKLERSMSLQTQDLMLSPPPALNMLDRTLSMDPFEFNLHTHNLSRTTTMTTIDNDLWDPLNSNVLTTNTTTTNTTVTTPINNNTNNNNNYIMSDQLINGQRNNDINTSINTNDLSTPSGLTKSHGIGCGIFEGNECLCNGNDGFEEFDMNDMNINPTTVGKNDNFNYMKDNMKNYVINENDELDLNYFIKTEEDQIGLMGL